MNMQYTDGKRKPSTKLPLYAVLQTKRHVSIRQAKKRKFYSTDYADHTLVL